MSRVWMRGRLALGMALLVAVVIAGPAAAPASAQLPSTSTALPGAFNAMVVDPATSHVFVSMALLNEIAVFDFGGTLVQTINGEAGAYGMTVVGNHLYVVAANAGAIDEIDTGTLTRTRTVVNGLPGMADVVAANGYLWVTT